MSIKLDWEVESDGGWSEVGEDAAEKASRQRAARRARRVVIVVLVVGLLIGGLIGARLYTADQQLRADLRATVAAETAAIRIGDGAAYLDIQQNIGSWREMQQNRFSQYQAQVGHLKADGEIVKLDIDGGKGRVVAREMLDGKPYNVVWFYQHDGHVWKHVPPEIAFWGYQRDTSTNHFSINGWDEDAAFAEKLGARLEDWWQAACAQTGCRNAGGTIPEQMKIRIEPDPLLQMGWAVSNSKTLRIPSPLLGRVPADGSLDPDVERAVAGYAAEHWVRELMENPTGAPGSAEEFGEQAWVRHEFKQWLVASSIPGEPPAPLFSPLEQTYTHDAVMALIAAVKQGQPVVPALEQITGTSAANLPVLWDDYLTYRLRAEAQLVQDGHSNEAMLLYRDTERATQDFLVGSEAVPHAPPLSIRVVSTHRYGELLWAETRFAANDGSKAIFEPFRLVGGRWAHSMAVDQDFGEQKQQQSQHLSLRYRDVDTPTVNGMLPELEQQVMTIISDLGIAAPPMVDIDVVTYETSSGISLAFPSNQDGAIRLVIGSPYRNSYPAGLSLRDAIQNRISAEMVIRLAQRQAGGRPQSDPLVAALTARELAHLGLDAKEWMARPASLPGLGGPPKTLEGLWEQSLSSPNDRQNAVAARTLVDLLVEQYGDQAVPLLLNNLAIASSMDDWLFRSLGIQTADIEPMWALRMATTGPLP